jgi:hypothetical protein
MHWNNSTSSLARKAISWKKIRNQSTNFQVLEGAKSSSRKATETREKAEAQRPVRITPKRHCRSLILDDWDT